MRPARALSVVLVVASAGYLAATFLIPEPAGQYVVVGPRAFPFAIGVGLVVCAVWLGLQPASAGPTAPLVAINWSRVSGCTLVLLAYISLFEPLGYVVSTTALIATEARILGSRSWSRNLGASGLVAASLYGILVLLLGLPLP